MASVRDKLDLSSVGIFSERCLQHICYVWNLMPTLVGIDMDTDYWLRQDSVNVLFFTGHIFRSVMIQRVWASYQIRKMRAAHATGMPGTFSPPPRISDPEMHHGTCVRHVPWCMSWSLTSGFLWFRWRRKRSRYSRRMRNLQFNVSGKRPVAYA